jgi:hypothetical protein
VLAAVAAGTAACSTSDDEAGGDPAGRGTTAPDRPDGPAGLADPDGWEGSEGSEGSANGGEGLATPVDAVLAFVDPASCAEAVHVYSSRAWEMLSDPGLASGAEDAQTPAIAGMSREQAVAACERDPSIMRDPVDQVPLRDDLEVTDEGGDEATVVWSQSSDAPGGSGTATYRCVVVREDGGWRVDDFNVRVDFGVDFLRQRPA